MYTGLNGLATPNLWEQRLVTMSKRIQLNLLLDKSNQGSCSLHKKASHQYASQILRCYAGVVHASISAYAPFVNTVPKRSLTVAKPRDFHDSKGRNVRPKAYSATKSELLPQAAQRQQRHLPRKPLGTCEWTEMIRLQRSWRACRSRDSSARPYSSAISRPTADRVQLTATARRNHKPWLTHVSTERSTPCC